MNREIKFRGKNVETNKWMYGYLREVFSLEKRAFVIAPANAFGNDGYTDIDEDYVIAETIGQFTGLKDMRGKDIYEGDIVSWPRDNMLYLIKFQSGGFYASVEEFNKGIYGGFPLYALTECEEDELVCSVVGNIFDNKNLLEE